MIQILAYRGDKPNFRQKFINEAPSIPFLFKNIKAMLEKIPVEETYNLHLTIASCASKTRTFVSQEIIVFDIENCDETRKDEYSNLVSSVFGVDHTKTGVVWSGHGMHFYIQIRPFDEMEAFDAWKPYYHAACQLLQRAMIDVGLPGKVDTSIFAPSHTIRLPETTNRKFGRPDTKCYLIQNNIELQPFELTKFISLGSTHPETLKSYPPVDTKAVLEECLFIKHCYEHQEKVTEPEWYAMLSVVSRLDGGGELCHQFSQNHPGYNENETEYKIHHALASSGPRTCKNIDTLWDGCKECPHYQKAVSPIVLKGKDYIKSKDTGFHTIAYNKDNLPLKPVPDYDGLIKYFEQEHQYIVLENSREVFIWEGKHWRPIPEARITAFAQTHFKPSANEAMRQEFLKRLRNKNLVEADWFNQSTSGKMNFQNGILDIPTMQLKPHSTSSGFMYVLPYAYDPQAKSPIFDKFMLDITCGQAELANILLEFAGFAFAGHQCNPAKALLLVGEGANGKSTFLKLLKELAGKNAYSCISLAGLQKDVDRYALRGKLFNVSEETPRKAMLDSSTFKDLVSGGEISVKQLYHDPEKYKNFAKMMFACNELPFTPDTTKGMMRRLLIVPFRNTFEGKSCDLNIERKMSFEFSGIFNKIICAYQRFLRQGGFSHSAIVDSEVNQYSKENNPCQMFVDEKLEMLELNPINDEIRPAKLSLYGKFTTWFTEMGHNQNYRPTFVDFCRQLNRIIPDRGRHGRTKADGQYLRCLIGYKMREADKIDSLDDF